jgi:predicted Ser/Thr protein kinase
VIVINDFEQISVDKGLDTVEVQVHNPTKYALIGKGRQGAVFNISSDRCVKIYWNPKSAMREAEVLNACKGSGITPKLYETGQNYVVMEYIPGQSLQEYLEGKSEFPATMVNKIVSLFKQMERLQFSRMDVATKHVIITKKQELKIIDHTNSFKKTLSFPRRFFDLIRKMGLLDSFLQRAKKIDKRTYSKWEQDYLNYREQKNSDHQEE